MKKVKEIKMSGKATCGFSDEHNSVVGVELDNSHDIIRVYWLLGTAPVAEDLFYVLLADKDVRTMIARYQLKGRKYPFLVKKERRLSGAVDLSLFVGKPKGGFSVTKKVESLHITCFGKLSDVMDDEDKIIDMYIGDFVEIVAKELELSGIPSPEALLEKVGEDVEYIPARKIEDISDFKNEVTKIL